MRWPAGLDARRFLAEHWQKRPVLLRGALPGFESVVDGDDLAGLACDDDLESRLVIHDPDDRWALRHGPFDDADFASLPDRGWTLLVQDVDKHLPEVAAVLAHFDFLPDWRLDDVMISYAAPGGSVGPHVDSYDVFLLQADGRRGWALDPAPRDLTLRPDAPLRLLDRFEPRERLELLPGDVLYLPPGVAHHGVGDVAAITWSVGFRAPSAGDLLRELARSLDDREPVPRYADPDLSAEECRPGQLAPAAVGRALALLEAAAGAVDARAAADALGRAATRPKPWLAPTPAEDRPTCEAIARRLRAGERLRRSPRARVAWHDDGDDVLLFAAGASWRLPARLAAVAACCAGASAFGWDSIEAAAGMPDALDLLAELTASGSLEWVESTRGASNK